MLLITNLSRCPARATVAASAGALTTSALRAPRVFASRCRTKVPEPLPRRLGDRWRYQGIDRGWSVCHPRRIAAARREQNGEHDRQEQAARNPRPGRAAILQLAM